MRTRLACPKTETSNRKTESCCVFVARPALQPGGTFLACSTALTGSTLAAVQTSGGYVSPFGLPSSSSYASSQLACAAMPVPLPYGTGGNPIGLAYNGQLIDVVRWLRVRAPAWRQRAGFLCAAAPARGPARPREARHGTARALGTRARHTRSGAARTPRQTEHHEATIGNEDAQ
jgi:hypothetical protein